MLEIAYCLRTSWRSLLSALCPSVLG